MAVNSNEDIEPEKADMMLFAEDLVDFMLIGSIHNYFSEWNPIPFREQNYSAYAPVAKVVSFLCDTMEDEHDDLHCELLKENFVNSESYEIFAKTLAAEYFSEGFDEKYFLIYCVNLSKMASYFYGNGIVDVPDLAKIHIYKCLQKYDILSSGWGAIHKFAGNYEKLLLDSGNLTPSPDTSPDTNLVSDEIKHQDQKQEEMSIDTNSLQIEEQSVSLENEESKLKQVKELARIFHSSKTYQNKYIRYSSKSRSEIGLCSLQEPESFSEDKSPRVTLEENQAINRLVSDNEPTPDTSNIDQELILIISDFKKKMDLLWNEIKCGD